VRKPQPEGLHGKGIREDILDSCAWTGGVTRSAGVVDQDKSETFRVFVCTSKNGKLGWLEAIP
jgi:hypothetical protein